MSHSSKFIPCEVCGEKTKLSPDAIMQTCDECKDLFELEMSKVELREIYRDIKINIVNEEQLYAGTSRTRKTQSS